jgi:DNA-binding transcriptional MerR regulator
MQQLDLFGFPIEPAAQPRKKEKPSQPAIAIAKDPLPIPEPVTEMVVAPAPENVKSEPDPVPVAVSQPTSVTPKISSGKRGRKSFKEMDSEADLIEIPDDEILQQKLYYSISEVAGWFKVNTSLLRYWENEFDILQPRKTRKGDRLFRVEDIKNLQLIYFLLRQRKFSIDGAKNYLKNNRKEANTQVQLVESLTKFKSFLLEMKANLAL